MAIKGMGTDIIQIARLEEQLKKSDRLAKRVLTEPEMSIFAQHSYPARYLAKRFAAKEAAVKAIGIGIGNGISWQQVEVQNLESGQPVLKFSGYFAQICEEMGVNASHVSISDEQDYAVATVILEAR